MRGRGRRCPGRTVPWHTDREQLAFVLASVDGSWLRSENFGLSLVGDNEKHDSGSQTMVRILYGWFAEVVPSKKQGKKQ